ncbi:MAG: flippase-like domain-containing protein [Deltaproteobacteria bacterium]|nr:flippase-like domain-containing protein [Deltaproteobacteria bacterium]
MSNILKFILKSALILGIFVYLIQAGHIETKSLLKGFLRVDLFCGMICLYFIILFNNSWRWQFLLKGLGFRYSFKEVFQLSSIGIFFNTFLPGAVGGDFIKAYYIYAEEKEKQKKIAAILSVFLDRVVGLFGLISCAMIIFFLNYTFVTKVPLLLKMSWIVSLICFLGFIFYILIHTVSDEAIKKITLLNLGSKIFTLKKINKWVLKTYFLSFTPHFLTIFMFYLSALALGYEGGILPFLIIVPYGTLIMALPLTPAGLGVGQAAFLVLFKLLGLGTHVSGAEVATLVHVCILVLNFLIGGFYYVRLKRGSITKSSFVIPLSLRGTESEEAISQNL